MPMANAGPSGSSIWMALEIIFSLLTIFAVLFFFCFFARKSYRSIQFLTDRSNSVRTKDEQIFDRIIPLPSLNFTLKVILFIILASAVKIVLKSNFSIDWADFYVLPFALPILLVSVCAGISSALEDGLSLQNQLRSGEFASALRSAEAASLVEIDFLTKKLLPNSRTLMLSNGRKLVIACGEGTPRVGEGYIVHLPYSKFRLIRPNKLVCFISKNDYEKLIS